MDPFLWSAYEALCDLGADIDAARFFGPSTSLDSGGLHAASYPLSSTTSVVIDQAVGVDMSPRRPR